MRIVHIARNDKPCAIFDRGSDILFVNVSNKRTNVIQLLHVSSYLSTGLKEQKDILKRIP